MSKQKIDWKNHLLEFITVVIGILLAFGLNNFNENRKDRKAAQLQLERIIEEIKNNSENIKDRYSYHQEMLSLLRKEPDSVNIVLKLSNPVSYAWNIAQNSTFKDHIKYNKIVDLERIYKMQQVLLDNNYSVGDKMNFVNIVGPDFLMSIGNVDKAKEVVTNSEFKTFRKVSWIPIFEDICLYEKTLIDYYDRFLGEND